jgi:hypothetical protein
MGKQKRPRKKKHVSPAEQKKQQEAQYNKFVMDKLRNLCLQIEGDALYRQIPLEDKIVIYKLRGAPIKVAAAPGTKVKKWAMVALTTIIKQRMQTMQVEVIKDSGKMMSFSDYILVGRAFESIVSDSDHVLHNNEQVIKFLELQDERLEAFEKGVQAICQAACFTMIDIEQHSMYRYHFKDFTPAIEANYKPQPLPPKHSAAAFQKHWQEIQQQDFRLCYVVEIIPYPLEVRKITTADGETHPAIQLGIFFGMTLESLFYPYTIAKEDLPTESPFLQSRMPVYIQKHALKRMKERLIDTYPCFYYSIFMETILKKEYIQTSPTHILIACYSSGLKVGYLVAEIIDGIVLIRTFLLLTNTGTPEGNKLAQLTGLKAEDRRYLSIDTLHGLAYSDIDQNEAICELFRTAGCGPVLEFCKKMRTEGSYLTWLIDPSHPQNLISDLITEYMKPHDEEEEDDDEGATFNMQDSKVAGAI